MYPPGMALWSAVFNVVALPSGVMFSMTPAPQPLPPCVKMPKVFNWHSLGEYYVNALSGSELILSFMSMAELRMGAISAGWGNRRRLLLEQFMQGFELFYADNDLCTV